MNNLETFFNLHQLTLIMPEVFLLGSIVFILMLDLFLSDKNKQKELIAEALKSNELN